VVLAPKLLEAHFELLQPAFQVALVHVEVVASEHISSHARVQGNVAQVLLRSLAEQHDLLVVGCMSGLNDLLLLDSLQLVS